MGVEGPSLQNQYFMATFQCCLTQCNCSAQTSMISDSLRESIRALNNSYTFVLHILKIHISSPACTLRYSLRELLLKFPRPMYSLNTFSPNNHAEAVNLSTWVQEVNVHNSPGYRQLFLTYYVIYLDALKFNFTKL